MTGPEPTDVTGYGWVLRVLEVFFTAGTLMGWFMSEAFARAGWRGWLAPLVLLAGGGLGFWLAGRPRYVRWVFDRLLRRSKPDGERVAP